MIKMTIHNIHTVKVTTHKISHKVNKTLIVQMKTIIEKIIITKIIMIIRMILMISRFIRIKMMTQILIKEGEDLKDPKIKRL